MKVVILGAGPCGLTAAWELSSKGVDVTVVEKDLAVGGLCKTVRKNGYQFDLGGHRFISKDSELVADIKQLMQDELLTRQRKSVIRFYDREYSYPLNLGNVLSVSSPWMNLKFAGGYASSLVGIQKARTNNNSFESWIDERFGKPLNDFFFKPYTEKLWGIPASELSSEWAAQRISVLDGKDILMKLFGFSGRSPRTYASKYLYPKRGIGSIFEFMADKIKQNGGKVLNRSEVVAIRKKDDQITGVVIKKVGNDEVFIEADCFLSTIPVDQLSAMCGSPPSPLPYRSLRFLNIALNREQLSQNTWMYVPEQDMIMTRIQEPKRRSPYSAPSGKTSVMLEIPCEKDGDIWNMGDENLYDRVISDLKKLGFDISSDVIEYFSTFTEHAYPRYELGYNEKLNAILGSFNGYENLTTLGRQGLFRYIFMDTAMLMGRRWARSVLNRKPDTQLHTMDSESTLLEAKSVAF